MTTNSKYRSILCKCWFTKSLAMVKPSMAYIDDRYFQSCKSKVSILPISGELTLHFVIIMGIPYLNIRRNFLLGLARLHICVQSVY